MFSFGRKSGHLSRAGIVVDIGSASVDAAIVFSEEDKGFPAIVWSHHEYLSEFKKGKDLPGGLLKALEIVLMELQKSGLKQLKTSYPDSNPELIQISIAAPFSYSVVKRVNIKSDKPFQVSEKLIKEMEGKAVSEVNQQMNDSISRSLNLGILSNSVFSLTVNGYLVDVPTNTTALEVSLCQLITLTDKVFLQEIREVCHRVFPKLAIDIDSFMSLYLRALVDISPSISDACLISITAEATEILTLQDGIPTSSKFLKVGQYSLARLISQTTDLTFSESLGFMKENGVDSTKRLSDKKISNLESISSDYVQKLETLFRKDGGILSIPKNIYLHTDSLAEEFFIKAIAKAASATTGLKHRVIPITSEFFNFAAGSDSNILSSTYVFHKKLYQDDLQIRKPGR